MKDHGQEQADRPADRQPPTGEPAKGRTGEGRGGEGRTLEGASHDKLGLEDIVHLANKVGLEYVAAKKEAERLDLLKPSVRAQITLRLDNGSVSETKLRRLTETDPEYLAFIEKLANAKGEADRLRIRYESYKNLFEARRSLLSYQKAEMKLL